MPNFSRVRAVKEEVGARLLTKPTDHVGLWSGNMPTDKEASGGEGGDTSRGRPSTVGEVPQAPHIAPTGTAWG